MLDIRKTIISMLLFISLATTAFAQKTATEEKTDKSDQADKVEATESSKKTSDKDEKNTDEEKEQEPAKAQLRQISLSGNYVDLVQPMQFNPTSALLGGSPPKQRSFYKLCKFIDDLADDDEFDYVALDLSAGQIVMNGAQLDELSRHLKKLSMAGKQTFAWLENASNVHLSIAACCDEVLIADFGSVDMPSMGMQSMFFKDAMDLMGVKASVVRAGDFKGAVEPFLNPKMSDHLRDHYKKMLISMNDAAVNRISLGRSLDAKDVREMQGKRIFLPQEALDAGLVDRLAPYGAMKESITDEIDEPIDWITAKEKKKKDLSFFQLMGEIMAGPPNSGGRIRDNTIAVLHLAGPIMDGKKAVPGNMISGPTVELIEKVIEEDKIKGVVVRVNSPGGSASASESIRQALVKLTEAKPCVVSMGNMAASGGYWISCIDAPVYAERGTLTGSIGVFSMKVSTGALMRRVGVHVETIALDESSGIFAMDRPWSEEDTKSLQGTVDSVYTRFLKLVSKSRGIQMKKVKKIAGGRVWSGSQAKELKLVDRIGGVDDCLAAVAKKAKLDSDYRVIHRPVAQTGLDLSELLGGGGEEQIWSGVSKAAVNLLKQRGLSLETTQMLLKDGLTKQGKPTMWLLSPMEFSVK